MRLEAITRAWGGVAPLHTLATETNLPVLETTWGEEGESLLMPETPFLILGIYRIENETSQTANRINHTTSLHGLYMIQRQSPVY